MDQEKEKIRSIRNEQIRETEIRQVLDRLRRLIRVSDLSQRKVEERAGFSRGYLSQLLACNLDLKMWHVLAILDVLDYNPGQFFRRLYPVSGNSALESFTRASEPLSPGIDETLARLYGFGVDSLDQLRRRLESCEEAIRQLENAGQASPAPREPKG